MGYSSPFDGLYWDATLIELEKEGLIYKLTMDAGENRWNTTFVREFSAALDKVEQDDGPGALVTCATDLKFLNSFQMGWILIGYGLLRLILRAVTESPLVGSLCI